MQVMLIILPLEEIETKDPLGNSWVLDFGHLGIGQPRQGAISVYAGFSILGIM